MKTRQWLFASGRFRLVCLLCLVWAAAVSTAAASAAAASAGEDFAFVQPQFEPIGDTKSIPEGTITALVQDARGLIWIGTQQGLISYDGYRFRHFAHDTADPASLAGNFIIALWAAGDGRIWVGSNSDGLSVFDPSKQRFEHFKPDPKRPDSLADSRISALTGDAEGGMWIATNQGLDYLPRSGKSFIHYRHDAANPNSLLNNRVRSLLRDKQGRLWVGSASGLQRMMQDGKGFELIAGGTTEKAAINIQTLFEAQDGKVWVGTHKHGAAWLMPSTASAPANQPPMLHWLPLPPPDTGIGTGVGIKTSSETLSHPWVTGMAQIQADQIWLATYGGGINIVTAADGRVLQHLRHDLALSSSLALDVVKPLLFDQAGLLWVGTWGGGLQRFNTKNRMVRLLRHGQSLPTGLSLPNVRSMLELSNGKILFGNAGNGIDIFDRKLGLTGGYRAIGKQASGLPDLTILSLAETKDGTLWAGTQKAGVVRMLPGTQVWQSVPGLPSPQVRRLLPGRDGSVWAATDRGVARWRARQTGTRQTSTRQTNVAQFESVPDEHGKPMQNTVLTLAEDQQGRIWAGSDKGLWVMESDGIGLHGIHPEPGRPDSLISDFINNLLIDSQGRLWLSTDKGLERLLHWDGKVAQFEHISIMLGQASQPLNGNLLEDKTGRIWNELAVIDPNKMRMVPLTTADGMNAGTSASGAYGKTRDGLLFFGGTQGVAIINPALFQAWDYAPPIVATELKINGKPAPLGVLAQVSPSMAEKSATPMPTTTPTLTLTPAQRDFAIEFASLDYSAPDKNRYQYRLQGYEHDWIDTDFEHRSASYGNLRPGDYILQVRGSNRLGDWSRHELKIPIRVLPAFWETWWFMIMALLMVSGAAYSVVRWRTTRLKILIAARTADILKLGEIGQELTSTLDTEQAFGRIYKQVCARLDAAVFSIGIYNAATAQIVFGYTIENTERQPARIIDMSERDRPAVWCVREQRELITLTRAGLLNYVGTVLPPKGGAAMETVVYLPLILEQKVIGCLSAQSLRQNAYDRDQLEFLRVLASYTAIALSNSTAHGDLTAAHRNLKETQSQLVQAEKMASLGQLVANVAHEINTPISAVKASSSNISDALERTLVELPQVFKFLSDAEERLFIDLIGHAGSTSDVFSSREARIAKLDIAKQLSQEGIANATHKADILTQLHAYQMLPETLPLLRHPQADLILSTANDVASIINNTSNINLAVARISKIVFALNAFSQNSTNGKLIQSHLAEGLETVLTLYQTQLRNGTKLVREFEEIPPIFCLPDELNQVWTHLIHNALQAMGYQGTLTLGIRQVGDDAVVSVADTGCGIPEEIRSKIFDAFFTTKPIGEGSGLGLNIVNKIISRHHGRIEVQSEVGAGTTFLIYLPYEVMPV